MTEIKFYKIIQCKILIDKCVSCGNSLEYLEWDKYEQKKYCDKCELIYDFEELYKDGIINEK
jgi:hypothetical protein